MHCIMVGGNQSSPGLAETKGYRNRNESSVSFGPSSGVDGGTNGECADLAHTQKSPMMAMTVAIGTAEYLEHESSHRVAS
jgi:hypothetical protein